MALIDDIHALLPTGGVAEISAQDLRDIFSLFIPGYATEGHTHVEADVTDLDHPHAGGGAGQLIINFHGDASGNLVLTNQANAEQFLANTPRSITRLDLSPYSQVRLVTRVISASSSINNPRIYLEYHTSFSTTVGDYSDIGDSLVSTGLTAAGLIDTGWIDLVASAQDDVVIALLQNGGNAASDPQLGPIMVQFR